MIESFRAAARVGPLLFASPLLAQSATPDGTFGNNGLVVVQNYGSTLDVIINDKVEQPDGSIVLTGTRVNGSSAQAYAQRLTSSGTLDPDFAEGGRFLSPSGLGALGSQQSILKPNGEILLIGMMGPTNAFDITLLQLTPDGDIDSSFGNDGLIIISADDGLVVCSSAGAPDGSVYILGNYGDWPCIIHILQNGTPDPEFGGGGMVVLSGAPWPSCGMDLKLAPQGYLVVLASRLGWVADAWCLAALDLQGNLLPWFGENGYVAMDMTDNDLADEYAAHMVLRNDGGIITSGYWYHDQEIYNAYWSFLPDGTIDESFGSGGVVELAQPENAGVEISLVDILPDGDLLLSGAQNSSNGLLCKTRLVRLNSNGSLETEFGENGVFLHYRPGAVFQFADKGGLLANGNLAVVGSIAASGGTTKNAILVFRLDDITTTITSSAAEAQYGCLYPNPATDRITVSGWSIEPSSTLDLLDAQGRCVSNWPTNALHEVEGAFTLELPAQLPSGAYALVLGSRSARRTEPLVITR